MLRSKRFTVFISGALILFSYMVLAPSSSTAQVVATTRYVAQTAAECTALGTTPCYTTIKSAIDAAITACENQTGDNDTIIISPGTYSSAAFSAITKDCSLTLYGRETASTILSGGTSDTLITAENLTASVSLSVTIYNLKFKSAGTGIRASSFVSLTVTNSIFEKITGTAISLSKPQAASISNNTFYQNGTGIARDDTVPIIKNNIFYGNAAAISTTVNTNLSKNCYYTNSDDTTAVRESSAIKEDPLFVDPVKGDYHLQVDSPCINAGDTSVGSDVVIRPGETGDTLPDVGAYGGPNADTTPFIVAGVDAVPTPLVADSVTVSWQQNKCYQVAGYNVYYGTASRTYGTPVDAGTNTSLDIGGLSSTPTPPTGAPLLDQPTFGSGYLDLAWHPKDPVTNADLVTGATGYEVRYNTSSPPGLSPSQDAKNSTTYRLSGLTNGTTYYIVVVPYAESTYYFAVKAYYGSPPSYLSEYSEEVDRTLGSKAYSVSISNQVDEYPESIDPYPPLPNQGCFIATAAYGYYSAPEVKALREFRDRYLVANGPGRAFVRWYYRVSPSAAQYITEHPSLKPVVRVALAPAVGTALFMTGTSSAVKLLVFMMMLSLALYVRQKRINRLTREGTEQ